MIATSHLFRPLSDELIGLLRGLSPEDWMQPTSAPHWTVRDVAAHLLDVALRRVSSQRDGYMPPPTRAINSNADLVAYLNELNRIWVEAARRLSTQVIVDELESATQCVAELFERSDPMAPAIFPVAWAGEDTSRMWFDIAREYTESWHHQDQIRDAVGAQPLSDARWLRPALETSLLALPHAYRDVHAVEGTTVRLCVRGAAGGDWSLVKTSSSWILESGAARTPVCTVHVSDLDFSRLLLHRLKPADARRVLQTDGDLAFAAPLLSARAVMV